VVGNLGLFEQNTYLVDLKGDGADNKNSENIFHNFPIFTVQLN
jgi:hypothetical protein